MDSCVASLARLLGIDETAARGFDWLSIERSLGLSLPVDYKALAEIFPPGRFQGFVGLCVPGDVGDPADRFIGDNENLLGDMRAWRKSQPELFPYPIYPESGGLLPWSITHRGDPIFWLTSGSDPSSWSIVVTDLEFSHWTLLKMSTCRFLTEVVEAKFDASNYDIDLAGSPPFFDYAESSVHQDDELDDQGAGVDFWLGMQLWPAQPAGAQAATNVNELVHRLGDPPAEAKPVDWRVHARQFGAELPLDYRVFMDKYGPGTLGELTIAGPGGLGYANLDALVGHLREMAFNATSGLAVSRRVPIFPEVGGMIPWGRTSDAKICGWAPVGARPENWGIAIVDEAMRQTTYRPDLAFATLLLDYIDPGQLDPISFRDVERPFPMLFTSFANY